jgi:hypothetical protein
MSTSDRTVEELALELYRGLPAAMMRFAQLQIRAGLEKLMREGRVAQVDEKRWRLRETPQRP